MKHVCLMSLSLLAIVVCGCSESPSSRSENTATATETAGGTQYLASEEPQNALNVGEARTAAKTDDSITIVGRIGGSAEPFVDGLAAFTLVDMKVEYCAADEGCPTPWDYCCKQDEVKDNIATVKLIDAQGNPIAEDARKLLGVKELSVVVAEGTARRDDSGNLTIAATKIFIRPVQ